MQRANRMIMCWLPLAGWVAGAWLSGDIAWTWHHEAALAAVGVAGTLALLGAAVLVALKAPRTLPDGARRSNAGWGLVLWLLATIQLLLLQIEVTDDVLHRRQFIGEAFANNALRALAALAPLVAALFVTLRPPVRRSRLLDPGARPFQLH